MPVPAGPVPGPSYAPPHLEVATVVTQQLDLCITCRVLQPLRQQPHLPCMLLSLMLQ